MVNCSNFEIAPTLSVATLVLQFGFGGKYYRYECLRGRCIKSFIARATMRPSVPAARLALND